MRRVFFPSAPGVSFVEVVIGDILTSLCKVLGDIAVAICILMGHFM